MDFDQRRRSRTDARDDGDAAPTVGSSTRTQRHVARMTTEQRVQRHAILDRVWGVQLARDTHTGLDDGEIRDAAAHGIAGSGGALPHLDAIQRSFGEHDVSSVQAHVGGPAAEASGALGAHAYATGDHVAFASQPSLFLAAHEAAHVVQQRAGVQLSSAVGHAGDTYEQQADAVAARVVAGESAADLLGPARGGGGTTGVQRQELELGPAGPGGNKKKGVDYYAPPPKQAPNAVEKAMSLGAAAMPVIKGAMEHIKLLKDVWDLVKPGGGRGETKQLGEQISQPNKTDLDRGFAHKVGEAFLEHVFRVGEAHGVKFKEWHDGKPNATAGAGSAMLGNATAGVPAGTVAAPADASSPAADAAGLTPPAGKPPEAAPPEAAALISELQSMTIADLKSRAVGEMQSLIAANSVRLAPVSWWWNGANQHNFGDPPPGIGDAATWGKLTFHLAIAQIPMGTKAGVPAEASHFGIPPTNKQVHALAWFTGGRAEIQTHEGALDDLSVSLMELTENPAENMPIGAQHLAYAFDWDDASSSVDLDLTFNPYSRATEVRNITTGGDEPET